MNLSQEGEPCPHVSVSEPGIHQDKQIKKTSDIEAITKKNMSVKSSQSHIH